MSHYIHKMKLFIKLWSNAAKVVVHCLCIVVFLYSKTLSLTEKKLFKSLMSFKLYI